MLLEGTTIITGGYDGKIMEWNLNDIELAEVTEEEPIFVLEPLREMELLNQESDRQAARVQAMVRGPGHWLVQDEAGALFRVDLETRTISLLLKFHSGAITGLDTSPVSHTALTCGADGSVRLWEYVEKKLSFTMRFNSGATTAVWATRTVDPDGRTIVCGFADGSLRVLQRCSDGMRLHHVVKPHACRLTHVLYSPNGRILVTGAEDGALFFLSVVEKYKPLGFMQANAAVTALCWAHDSAALIVAFADGAVLSLTPPTTDVDTTESYALPLAANEFELDTLRLAIRTRRTTERELNKPPPSCKVPPLDDEQGVEEGEAAELGIEKSSAANEVEDPLLNLEVRSIICYVDGTFLLSLASDEQTFGLWRCGWNSEPELVREYDAPATFLTTSRTGKYVISGCLDGTVNLAPQLTDAFWQGRSHDRCDFITARLAFDDSHLISATSDGHLNVSTFIQNTQRANAEVFLPCIVEEPASAIDLTDPNAYSLEEAKQKEELDARQAKADSKKSSVKASINLLQTQFAGEPLLSGNTATRAAHRRLFAP